METYHWCFAFGNLESYWAARNETNGETHIVAKYGSRWVQTRTIVNSIAPQWNKQYTWDVYDPCTIISIEVFDNGHIQGVDTPQCKTKVL